MLLNHFPTVLMKLERLISCAELHTELLHPQQWLRHTLAAGLAARNLFPAVKMNPTTPQVYMLVCRRLL